MIELVRSFQVHEKTVLLVAIPIVLHFPHDPLMCLWFLQIATFSMLPLLVVDKLVLAYVCTNLVYLLLIRVVLTADTAGNTKSGEKWDLLQLHRISSNRLLRGLFYASNLLGCTALTIGLVFVPPPQRFPHLFPLLIAVYSCGHFLIFLCYFNYKQWTTRHVDPISGGRDRKKRIWIVKINYKIVDSIHLFHFISPHSHCDNSNSMIIIYLILLFNHRWADLIALELLLKVGNALNKEKMAIKFTVSAPGKVILNGEHSVVYNKPALAGVIGLRNFIKLTVSPFALWQRRCWL